MHRQQHVNSTKALGRILRDRRKFLGLTQASTGVLVGLRQPTVSEIERGNDKTQICTLMKLIAALRLELVIQPTQSQETPWEEVWENDGT